jgi:DNA-binding GntR family transcriptional regulator
VDSALGQSIVPVRPANLRKQVYEQIRQAILDRKIKSGDHIRDREFTELLNTSRTPLREALGLLEQDGLVHRIPNRGWFVTVFSPSDVREIFFLRCGLENMAADLMIHRLTEQDYAELEAQIEELGCAIRAGDRQRQIQFDQGFHRRLVEMAGNKRLLQMWQNTFVQCAMVFNYHTVTLPNYDHWTGVRDHNAILAALRSGDPAAVHAVNTEINERVAEQCVAGLLAVEDPSGE